MEITQEQHDMIKKHFPHRYNHFNRLSIEEQQDILYQVEILKLDEKISNNNFSHLARKQVLDAAKVLRGENDIEDIESLKRSFRFDTADQRIKRIGQLYYMIYILKKKKRQRIIASILLFIVFLIIALMLNE